MHCMPFILLDLSGCCCSTRVALYCSKRDIRWTTMHANKTKQGQAVSLHRPIVKNLDILLYKSNKHSSKINCLFHLYFVLFLSNCHGVFCFCVYEVISYWVKLDFRFTLLIGRLQHDGITYISSKKLYRGLFFSTSLKVEILLTGWGNSIFLLQFERMGSFRNRKPCWLHTKQIAECHRLLNYTTVEPRFSEPLYSVVFDLTNNIFLPSNRKVYRKEPRYNETSL